MTDTTTQAVTALLDGLTPGPWSDDTPTHFGENARVSGPDLRLIAEVGNATLEQDEFDANARFIAAARDLVPAILAERDALAAQLAAAEVRAREASLDALAAYGQAADAHEAQLAAEAKLATAQADAMEEAAGLFHDEQLQVWADEILGSLAQDGLLSLGSYGDKVAAHWAVRDDLRSIAAAIRALAKGGEA